MAKKTYYYMKKVSLKQILEPNLGIFRFVDYCLLY